MTGKTNTAKNLKSLCEAAVMIALATVLGLMKFPPFYFDLWGYGGSIDFVMVPLIILGWRQGVKWAVPGCLAYGLIRCLIGGGIGYGLPSVLLDYVLAYGMVGLAGIFKGKKYGLFLGTLVASAGRFFMHFLSGITIWKIAAGDVYEIFGMSFDASTTALYSLIYNGSFMLGELVFCLVILALLWKPLEKIPK